MWRCWDRQFYLLQLSFEKPALIPFYCHLLVLKVIGSQRRFLIHDKYIFMSYPRMTEVRNLVPLFFWNEFDRFCLRWVWQSDSTFCFWCRLWQSYFYHSWSYSKSAKFYKTMRKYLKRSEIISYITFRFVCTHQLIVQPYTNSTWKSGLIKTLPEVVICIHKFKKTPVICTL